MAATIRIGWLLLALGGAACGPAGATQDQLLSRATFDLECPAPQVQVQDLGNRQRGVLGCGRRLTYVEVCEQRVDGNHCAWVINAAPWAYGPPMNKRPPTPPGTWFYSTPRPSQPGGRGGPPRPEPFPQGTAPPPISPMPPPSPPPPGRVLPPEPFPEGTAPPPVTPPSGGSSGGASAAPSPRNPPLLK